MDWQELLVSATTIVLSAGSSWALALRVARDKRVSDAHATAVQRLLPAVAKLRALLHASAAGTVAPSNIGDAIYHFEEICVAHEAALPNRLRGVRSEVRWAIGNYFGATALTFIDPEVHDYPLPDPDPYWRDISASYLDYVMREIQASLWTSRGRRMASFHQWRKEEDAYHRRAASGDGSTV